MLVGVKDKQGLCSIVTSRCTGCLKEFQFATSSRARGLSGGQYWECNLAAVWGQMATGGGHAPLTESMAILGIPSLTKKTFMAIEKRIGDWWRTLFNESMKQAGEEEKAIALSKDSRYDIPRITVIVDGGWSKRAHKHSYNAKSGVGIIIGKETGKILFMGVRNKYCTICHNASGGTIPEHTCFLNWDQSSSAMETDIIVEGFCQSETQHGLHYTEFIGDGDSSVHPTLVRKVPYGTLIKKVECANHAVKCFRGTLENLVQDNPSYKGRGKLTEAMRRRLTRSARCAIIMRSQESNKVEAVKKLQRDLMNIPLHCFGSHSKCSPEFCKTAQKNLEQQQEQNQHQTQEQQQLQNQHQTQEQRRLQNQQHTQEQNQQQQTQEQQQQPPPTDLGEMASNTEDGMNDTISNIKSGNIMSTREAHMCTIFCLPRSERCHHHPSAGMG